ncbi:MAG: hypothetical protein KJP09_09685 [Bacteroidia bacterium]|nr:hypothetical protein [Bacteroidia bacterium]NND11165.1 hypothetical protein [Flavobacteriaceae bacterium]MBT8309855.1 hypothetical protein [Bacteroidia bacterium]NNK28477.1 hypothetical protein [Flavobacteriaceae bacterium]RZV64361.1 MAG: hypothetical protein EX254_06055 [Flavobacteriaceae bacterium]
METLKQETTECCPVFHPEKWDEKSFEWRNKQFIKGSVPTFFHIPYPSMIGKQISSLTKIAEDANKLDSNRENILVLFADPHPFKSEIFMSVTGEVPDAKNITLTGNFMSKVFDGAYNDIPKFIKQMNDILNEKRLKASKYYVHYGYCPKCAEVAGHNYMVLFAEIEKIKSI